MGMEEEGSIEEAWSKDFGVFG